ncbi:hypothetical protein FDU21_22250 [Xanthomonas oryzae pv. oryzae]|nr:hypothetical protein FDU21_22250 [Xanthomonas oryzae pv. oryzae]
MLLSKSLRGGIFGAIAYLYCVDVNGCPRRILKENGDIVWSASYSVVGAAQPDGWGSWRTTFDCRGSIWIRKLGSIITGIDIMIINRRNSFPMIRCDWLRVKTCISMRLTIKFGQIR